MFVEDVYRSSLSKSLPLQFLRDESGIKFFFFSLSISAMDRLFTAKGY